VQQVCIKLLITIIPMANWCDVSAYKVSQHFIQIIQQIPIPSNSFNVKTNKEPAI